MNDSTRSLERLDSRVRRLILAPGLTSSNYDVTADGQRFLMIRDDDIELETSREIVLVQGWADELSRLSAKT